jgi:hypothetical protein
MTWRTRLASAVWFLVGCARPSVQEQDGPPSEDRARLTQPEPCCSAAGESFLETYQERAAAEQVLMWLTLLQGLSPSVGAEAADDVPRSAAVRGPSASTPARAVAVPVQATDRTSSKTRRSSTTRVEAR